MKTLRMAMLSTLILGAAPAWADKPVSLSGTIADYVQLELVRPGSVLVIHEPIRIMAGQDSATFEALRVFSTGTYPGVGNSHRLASCQISTPDEPSGTNRVVNPQALRVASVTRSEAGDSVMTTVAGQGQRVIFSCRISRGLSGTLTVGSELPLVEDLRHVLDWNAKFRGETRPSAMDISEGGPAVSDRPTTGVDPIEPAEAATDPSVAAHSAH